MRCGECNKVAYRAIPGAPVCSDSIDARDALPAGFALLEQEEFWVLCLDARHKVIARTMVARGSVSRCEVSVKDVFREAVRSNASGIIVAHNHPSGDPTPSADDVVLTRKLAQAGKILGVPLLDHLVIGRDGYRSLAAECG